MTQKAGLFLGTETYTWSLQQFTQVSQFAKSLGFSYLVLKTYEITQGPWYQGIGVDNVVAAIEAQGIAVLPYGYFYGNDVATEAAYILSALEKWGAFCMDCESEFDGDPAKMALFAQHLTNHPGALSISTWANPQDHNWGSVIVAINHLVQHWLPQVYTPYLLSVYKQQWLPYVNNSLDKIEPTFNSWQGGTPPETWLSPTGEFTVWESQGVEQLSPVEQQAIKGLLAADPPPVDAVLQQAKDVYAQSVPGARTDSGIYKAWLSCYTGKNPTGRRFNFGSARSLEFPSVDWSGNPIIMVLFDYVYCAWMGGHANFYDYHNTLIIGNVT